MRDRREKRFTVRRVDGDDGMSAIGRAKHDELSATIGFPSKEAAGNALLRHRAVIGLDADAAVRQRNDVETVLERRMRGFGIGREVVGQMRASDCPPLERGRHRIRVACPRRGSPFHGF